MKKSILLFFRTVVVLAALANASLAQLINFDVADLQDTVPGHDLWQYKYSISGGTFQSGQILSVSFDVGKYGNIENTPVAPNPDWSVLTLQPDPQIPDSGSYNAIAQRSNPSLSGSFQVSFDWLGGGTGPGAQSWTLFNSDFSTAASGTTIAPVPEPFSATATVLLLSGVAMWRIRRRMTP